MGWSSEAGVLVANESILCPPPGRSRRREREASCVPPERYEGSTVPVRSDHSGSRQGAPVGVSRRDRGGYRSALHPLSCAPAEMRAGAAPAAPGGPEKCPRI